jgi:hypothetical protein
MPKNSQTRKKIEDIIYSVYAKLDKTGLNGNRYKDLFKKMSDAEFFGWMEKFVKDGKANFRLEVLPFKNEPEFEDIEAAAKIIDCPLEEYIYFRDETVDGIPIRSKTKVPVGYVHVKRLQQMVSKKTQVGTSIKQRSAITNQVSNESRIARNSDVESYALILQRNNEVLKEFMGPRADNAGQKRAMYNAIARDGFVKRSDITKDDNVFEKSVLNAFDVYLLGAGIKSDLVTEGYTLSSSIKSNTD